jgi:hypothetical protein
MENMKKKEKKTLNLTFHTMRFNPLSLQHVSYVIILSTSQRPSQSNTWNQTAGSKIKMIRELQASLFCDECFS